nr:hypothetical protein [Shewanella acanthi]
MRFVLSSSTLIWKKLALQFTAPAKAEVINESQYRNGAVGIQDWLDAQENRRTAEASLLEHHDNQLSAQSMLYQALGGSEIAPKLTE